MTSKITENKGSFLRSDQKNWVSSNLFFHCIDRLGISAEIYYIPTGIDVTNDQLDFYVDHLLNAITKVELSGTTKEKEAKDYVIKVALILRAWVKEGYGVRVV